MVKLWARALRVKVSPSSVHQFRTRRHRNDGPATARVLASILILGSVSLGPALCLQGNKNSLTGLIMGSIMERTLNGPASHVQQAAGRLADETLALSGSQRQASAYQLLSEPLVAGHSAHGGQQQESIVFANNHQLWASTLRPPTPPALGISSGLVSPGALLSSLATGDQEFIVSSSPASGISSEQHPQPEVNATTTAPTPTAASLATTNASLPTVAVQPEEPATSSKHADLISVGSASDPQTTTPFTSSLSTALLPNISSRPFSPTEEPPLSSKSTESTSSLVPSQSFSSTLAAQMSSSSVPPPQLVLGAHGPPLTFSQLYNSLLAGAATEPYYSLGAAHLGHHPLAGTARPAATKIVGGGSLGTNNLIPGLSGLQSAILSHIPFKLATGLSSYLQAAMKPPPGRPLYVSNTAPAHTFQQPTNASQPALETVTSPAVNATPATALRFPSIQTSGPADPPSQWLESNAPQSSTGTPPTSSPTSSPVSDAAREAQLVCGRPQVAPAGGYDAPPTPSAAARRRVARIVGGNQSVFGQWPWMVSLRQWRRGAFLHKCGAALLNENWAITAAHCVENVQASDLLLRLGEFDVSSLEEPYPFVERRVKTVVSHPSFDPKTFEYDLALLRFAEPVRFERNIVPVCVPTGNDSYVDRVATVIGWGRLYEDGPLPDVIQHVDVPIITNNECEKMYKNAGYAEEIPDMFICAGISKGGRDSCEGDSGGPLTMVDHDGRSYLVGIISWGIGCALPSQPGVYTRITAFSGWINQITAY